MPPLSTGAGKKVEVEDGGRDPDRGEGPVDMRKPLIQQIPKLSRAEYLKWTHTGHIYSKAPKHARFFDADWMEALTMTVWWVIPTLWLPVAAAFAAPGFMTYPLPRAAAFLFAGVLLWTVIEYTLHRWVFHLDEMLPDHPTARLIHFLMHGVHHKVPMDPYRLVMPPVMTIMIAIPTYTILRFALSFLPWDAFNLIFAGIYLGYIGYDCLHFAFHHADLSFLPDLAYLKSHHMKHHSMDHNIKGFGIVTTIWDQVMGTTIPVPDPRKLKASAAKRAASQSRKRA